MNQKKKKNKGEQCVDEQVLFIILLFLYENREKYKWSGITLQDLKDDKEFIENDDLWQHVGQVRKPDEPRKKWSERINFGLSDLVESSSLAQKNDKRVFLEGPIFYADFHDIVEILHTALGFDIEDKHEEFTYFARNVRNKQLVMLTDRQIGKLVELSVDFGIDG